MLSRIVTEASAFLLGLLAGAMLLIALAIVPFWTSLAPADFRAWFAANALRIGTLMVPLGSAATLVALAALAAGWRSTTSRRAPLSVAAAGAVAIALITIFVNEPANLRFAAGGALTDAETTLLLQRWSFWHWMRVAFGFAAFLGSLRSLR